MRSLRRNGWDTGGLVGGARRDSLPLHACARVVRSLPCERKHQVVETRSSRFLFVGLIPSLSLGSQLRDVSCVFCCACARGGRCERSSSSPSVQVSRGRACCCSGCCLSVRARFLCESVRAGWLDKWWWCVGVCLCARVRADDVASTPKSRARFVLSPAFLFFFFFLRWREISACFPRFVGECYSCFYLEYATTLPSCRRKILVRGYVTSDRRLRDGTAEVRRRRRYAAAQEVSFRYFFRILPEQAYIHAANRWNVNTPLDDADLSTREGRSRLHEGRVTSLAQNICTGQNAWPTVAPRRVISSKTTVTGSVYLLPTTT